MFTHNLKIIFRGLLRSKKSFITNLIGMSTGLACVILIYLWVNDEFTFDDYFEKGDRLFQVMENKQQDGTIKTTGQTAVFLAGFLSKEMPEVEYSAVVTPPNFFPSFTLSATDRNIKGTGKFVSKDFFKVFTYPLITGNPGEVLENKSNIVLSESLAKKLFVKPENSIGKTVSWKLMGLKKETIVSGVYKDLKRNSSERFDFIVTFDSFKDLIGGTEGDINWDNNSPFFTYITLKEGTESDAFNSKIGNLLAGKSKNNIHRKLFVKKYTDQYLFGVYENGIQAGGRIEYVKQFSAIAIIILLIACINFMNLATAQAFKRFKETGIKRILGAERKTIIFLYMQEAFVVTLVSAVLAILIVIIVLPQFNEFSGKKILLVLQARTILTFILLIIVTTIIAGIYPSVYLSRFTPSKALKGKFNSSLGELWARKGLVVVQFSASFIFIVFVLIVYKQIEYIQAKNPGFNKDNIVYFEAEGIISQKPEQLISEIKKMPGVQAVSSMLGGIIAKNEGGGMPGTVEMNGKKVIMNSAAVNYGLIELLGMQMKEGRSFSELYGSDLDKVIYNEAAIEALGIKHPVGKIVSGKEIIGVVKNFNFKSIREPVSPYCFRLEPQSTSIIMVKFQKGVEGKIIPALEKVYKSYNPNFIFNYSFLDNDYQEQYAAEKRVSALSKYATGLAILISCLGLFGLVVFTTERRRKEIGIRKVLGSSGLGIVMLLSGEFIKLVIAAVLIAIPVSYIIGSSWLNRFAYRIDLEWWYFVGAAGVTIVLSWLAIVSSMIKAAETNPAVVLKAE